MSIQSLDQFEISIASELFRAGVDEFGCEYSAEQYRIVLVDSLGNRWELPVVFPGCEVTGTDEGFSQFHDTREVAYEKADHLLSRIKRKGEVDLDRWREARPVYGSVAYQQYGADDDIALERAEG